LFVCREAGGRPSGSPIRRFAKRPDLEEGMPRDIGGILKKISSARVLCLGDLMLDRYIYGRATRLSPEAPVPVLVVGREALMPGGLGNVVMNLHSLGASPLAVGLVGRDREAGTLSELLAGALGGAAPRLVADESRPTTVKTRVVAGIQQVVRYDLESESPMSERTEERYRLEIEKLLPGCGAAVVSDYGKGVVSRGLARWLMGRADALGIPVVVDPKGDDYLTYAGAALVTPNRQELALAVGKSIARASEEVLVAAGRDLMARCRLKNLLVTRSEDGMTLLSQTDPAGPGPRDAARASVRHFPAKAREVFDVSGAGDTVAAAMGAALASGLDLTAGAELATLAAAVVVGKVGAATASPGEILAAAAAL
jgi:D-beta-D-heptose 7-phosphate kinase/D-beta-D-heptose 1-phosphate adenosyltransferase